MPKIRSVKSVGRGRSRTYSAAKTRSYYKQYMTPKLRQGYTAVPRALGAAVTGEMKYFDCELSATAITATTTTWPAGTRMDPSTTINLGSAAVATPLCLCAPTVGAALNQRIGRKIHIYKLKIRGQIVVPVQAAQAASDNSTEVRLLVLLDKQTNAAQYTASAVLNDGVSSAQNSYQNPNSFGRFRVLKDKRYNISNINMTGIPSTPDVIQASVTKLFQFTIKFKNPILVNFNATNGGTVADIVDNSLHVMCGVNNAAYAPLLLYYSRVAYKE